MSHYEDATVFRTADGGGATFEASAPRRPDSSFVFSIDSWDGPEQGLRLDRESARSLAGWLEARLAEEVA